MNQDNVQRKVGDFMGGKVINLPEFDMYDKGKEEGIAIGEARGIALGEAERKKLVDENDRLKKELEELKKAKA